MTSIDLSYCIEELHCIIQTGSTKEKDSSFSVFTDTRAEALVQIFTMENHPSGALTNSQWVHVRTLAGITLKNFVKNPQFTQNHARFVAMKAFHELQNPSIKICRIAAQIIVCITKKFQLEFWRTAHPPIDFMSDLWALKGQNADAFISLAQYLIEDMMDRVIDECGDFVQRLASECRHDARFISLLYHTYFRGNFFDWFVEKEMWSREQIALCDASGFVVEAITDIISVDNATDGRDLIRLMTILIEYQDLCSISEQAAQIWTSYVVSKFVESQSSERSLFEACCWYIVALKDAYIEEDSECSFLKSIHTISPEATIPILLNSSTLCEEDVASLQEMTDFSRCTSADEYNQLEANNLAIVRWDRYVALKCIQCLGPIAAPLMHKYLVQFFGSSQSPSWVVQEAVILGYALTSTFYNEDSAVKDGLLLCGKILVDSSSEPLIRSSAAFAISMIVANAQNLPSVLKLSLFESVATNIHHAPMVLRINRLHALHAVVSSLSNELTESNARRRVESFLMDCLQNAQSDEVSLLIETFRVLFSEPGEAISCRSEEVCTILTKHVMHALQTFQIGSRVHALKNMLKAIGDIIPVIPQLSTNHQETFVSCAFEVIKLYHTEESKNDNDMLTYSVYLLTAIFEKYNQLRESIPYEAHRSIIAMSLKNHDTNIFNAILGYFSVLVKSPMRTEFAHDFEITYLKEVTDRASQPEHVSDILWCLADCFCAFTLSRACMNAIFLMLCKFMDKNSDFNDYDTQTSALCISRCLKSIADTEPELFSSMANSQEWVCRTLSLLRCVRLLPNDEVKANACKGILRFMQGYNVSLFETMEDLILLLASFHQLIAQFPDLKFMASNMLKTIKLDDTLGKQYQHIISNRRLQKFEVNCI